MFNKTKKLIPILLAALLLVACDTSGSGGTETTVDVDESSTEETGVSALAWGCDTKYHWPVDNESKKSAHKLDDLCVCTVCGAEVIEFDDSISLTCHDSYENIVRRAEYDKAGNILSDTVDEYTYDSEGHMLTSKETIDGVLSTEIKYMIVDGESTPEECIDYYDDLRTVSIYDEHGNIIEYTEYELNGKEICKTISEFEQSSTGEWFESKSTNTDTYGKIIASYNEYHDTLNQIMYGTDGTIESDLAWEYTYDADGHHATQKCYSFGKLVEETVFATVTTYDGSMTYPQTVTEYEEDGSKTVYVYNENNDILSRTVYDAAGKIVG